MSDSSTLQDVWYLTLPGPVGGSPFGKTWPFLGREVSASRTGMAFVPPMLCILWLDGDSITTAFASHLQWT